MIRNASAAVAPPWALRENLQRSRTPRSTNGRHGQVKNGGNGTGKSDERRMEKEGTATGDEDRKGIGVAGWRSCVVGN